MFFFSSRRRHTRFDCDWSSDVCSSDLVLPDSGRIQEEDARQANRHGYSRHQPAQPLYDEAAANRALTHLYQVAYGRPIEIGRASCRKEWRSARLLGEYIIKRIGISIAT